MAIAIGRISPSAPGLAGIRFAQQAQSSQALSEQRIFRSMFR